MSSDPLDKHKSIVRGLVPRVRRQPVAAEDRPGRRPGRRRFGGLPGVRRSRGPSRRRAVRRAMAARAGDPEFAEVRRAAQRIDAEYRKSTPWWGGYDLDDAHIFRAADRLVLLDVFRMGGTELYGKILKDV